MKKIASKASSSITPPLERLSQYRDLVRHGRGLTAEEWGDYDRVERHHEPRAYEARQARGSRHVAITTASQLDTASLLAVLAFRLKAEPPRSVTLPAVFYPKTLPELIALLSNDNAVDAVQGLMIAEDGRVTAYDGDQIQGLTEGRPDLVTAALREGRFGIVRRHDGR